jgi:hypothetical protein
VTKDASDNGSDGSGLQASQVNDWISYARPCQASRRIITNAVFLWLFAKKNKIVEGI